MWVLVACEESQEVCKAFRARGHAAYSCDIQECSGGHPEWHIRNDVLGILNPKDHGNNTLDAVWFVTMDGEFYEVPKWDLIIAHPPCTDLATSGARYFKKKQADGTQARSIEFFMQFAHADCEKIAIENPIGIMSTQFRKPDQIIQPWQFALDPIENVNKSTCLWLKGLPKLTPLHVVKPEMTYHTFPSGKRQSEWYYQTRCLPHKERSKAASKTFPGIARAMAEQWG